MMRNAFALSSALPALAKAKRHRNANDWIITLPVLKHSCTRRSSKRHPVIVGMRANDDNAAFAEGAGLNRAPSGFMAPRDMFLGNVKSNVEGIFYAGTVTAPKNIGESLNEGTAAADAAARYVGV